MRIGSVAIVERSMRKKYTRKKGMRGTHSPTRGEGGQVEGVGGVYEKADERRNTWATHKPL